jgi:hypothetical protein
MKIIIHQQKEKSIKNLISLFALSFLIISCSKKEADVLLIPVNTLDYYVNQNKDLERDILIACAASEKPENTNNNVSLFYYPVDGAYEFNYFEAKDGNIDPNDFTQYIKKLPEIPLPVFGGFLMRYPFTFDNSEPLAIMTYKSDGKLHICDPIKMKQDSKPTIYASQLITIDLTSPTEPVFSWETDSDTETVIYFQVVSDSLGNLISGTYTYDKHWKFYDLSNVVLNIHDVNPPPELTPNSKCKFTLMGVSEDNWVNLVGEMEFVTK